MGFLKRLRGEDEPEEETCPKCRTPVPLAAEECPGVRLGPARGLPRRAGAGPTGPTGERGAVRAAPSAQRSSEHRPAIAAAAPRPGRASAAPRATVNASATITTGASEAITETTDRSPSRVATV